LLERERVYVVVVVVVIVVVIDVIDVIVVVVVVVVVVAVIIYFVLLFFKKCFYGFELAECLFSGTTARAGAQHCGVEA
jgi:hypothetical protein